MARMSYSKAHALASLETLRHRNVVPASPEEIATALIIRVNVQHKLEPAALTKDNVVLMELSQYVRNASAGYKEIIIPAIEAHRFVYKGWWRQRRYHLVWHANEGRFDVVFGKR